MTEKRVPVPYTPSILIVDDDLETRRTFRRTLEDVGYFVSEAKDGREAWNAVVDGFFDLVVLDLSMPDTDGFEFIRAVRTELPRVKILAVSEFLDGALLRAAKNLGALACLRKPVSEETLLPEICNTLSASD